MSSLRLSVMSAKDEADYAALVARTPETPCAATLAYRDVLVGLGLGEPLYFLARATDGDLIAALPAFLKRAPAGTVLNSLPLVQSPGDVITPVTGPRRRDIVAQVRTDVLAHARDAGVDVCVFIGTPYSLVATSADAGPAPDFLHTRTTTVTDLTAPLALDHGAREGLRRAGKSQPTAHLAQTEAEAHAVWALYAENMNRIGVSPRSFDLFRALFHMGPLAARFVWAAVDGAMDAALVLLCHGDVVDYFAVGNTARGRQAQIATWLCAQELQAAQARGARFWNWGVSPTPAVAAFKHRFGATDRTYAIAGHFTGNVTPLLSLSPRELAAAFPEYFVMPYDRLKTRPDAG